MEVIYYLIFCLCTPWNFASNWFGNLAGLCNGMHFLLLNSNHWGKSRTCPQLHFEILPKRRTALWSKEDHPKYASTHPSAWLYFRLWASIFILAFQFRALQWYPGRIWYKSKVCRSTIDAEVLLGSVCEGHSIAFKISRDIPANIHQTHPKTSGGNTWASVHFMWWKHRNWHGFLCKWHPC